MGTARQQAKRRPNKLQFRIPYDGQPDPGVEAYAYVFDRQGNFLTGAPVKNEEAEIDLSPEQARRTQIFFGPPPSADKADEIPTLETMSRIRAYEPAWTLDPDAEIQVLKPIPELLWKYWLWCACRVRGKVVRPVTVGGTTQDMPVCHARVHICEVDRFPWIIWRLPDKLIFRLRDELIKELARPIRWPIPLPDPPPFRFDPGVIDPSPENIARLNRVAGSQPIADLEPLPGTQEMPASQTLASMNVGASPMMVQPLTEALSLNKTPEGGALQEMTLAAETRAALVSPSATVIRQTLAAQARLILPYLCLWDWLWPYYRCDEIITVETDGQGRFDTTISYLCAGDHPDLYFWVEFNIGGSWTPVYKPSVLCNTYWDYPCGSEVTLRVSDPRVPVCSDPPDLAGLQVAVMSIGNGVSIHEIQGASAGIAQGLTTAGQPFGGVLEPHVWFGRTALFAASITHYRWSYRRLTLSDGTTAVSDTWHAMDRKVIRHYAVIDPTPPDYPLSFVPDVMGPDPAFVGQNLFRIQPLNPPPGSSGWAPIDAREDSATAFLQSHLLEGGNAEVAAGKYELKLELFRNDGTQVNLTDAGIQLKIPTVNAPFGAGTVPTTPAPLENRILDGAGKVTAFRTVIHIDNTPCEAEIYTVSGPGLSVDANCGYIEYASDSNALHISFKARHLHNFATFSFTTYRGSSRFVAEASASGSVGASPINGFVRNPSSVFSKNVTVHTLLTSNTPPGDTPCSRAAFAENLYVWALATDGWHRLSYLDDWGTPKAFALAPVS